MRRLTILVLAALAALAIVTTPAQASFWPKSPTNGNTCWSRVAPHLCFLHYWVDRTHHAQAVRGLHKTPYYWKAERHPGQNPWITERMFWKRLARHVEAMPRSLVPAWFVSDMVCISAHEEYGMNGPNTSAGYFGFVYSPSTYVEPGPQVAAQYGDAWLDVPLSAQLAVAYALEQRYSWAPWSTAAGCGL